MTQAIRPAFINCAHCGTEKKLGQRGPIPTYCSGACRAAVKYQRTLVDGRYEAELAAARDRTKQRRQANTRPCPYCADPMDNPRRKQCGKPECKRAFNVERIRDWNRDYHAKHGAWPHRQYPESQRAASRRRRQRVGHWRKQYPERAAAYDARRRALVAQARTDEVFAPVDVHTRDGWACQLCYQPIDQSIAWPDPMSPSVDHVVPLSRGGAHALHNVQSAHLGCNSSKGDRLMVDMVIAAGGQAAT
jgi:5-methylcytosine-specific restriction endonuclease McrA